VKTTRRRRHSSLRSCCKRVAAFMHVALQIIVVGYISTQRVTKVGILSVIFWKGAKVLV